MALSTTSFTRRINLHGIVVGLSLTGALLAILPIVVGVAGDLFGAGGARTAFASAPAGDYAVFARAGDAADEIVVAPLADPAAAMPVGVIPHLAGFPSQGVVSPDGEKLALITVDAGSADAPGASLLVLDLESGELVRAAIAVDHLQEPLWTPDGAAVIVTRGGDSAPGAVALMRVNADASGETEISRAEGILGLFPVAFDGSGRLLSVVIDGRGSTLVRDGAELQTFSPDITRDWALSPDGTQLAFIDTALADGVSYEARTIFVEGGPGVAAQTLAGGPDALGVAWNPVDGTPQFGLDPASGASGGITAQTLASGFDVPLDFAGDGTTLAVQHWTGAGFDNPGSASIELVSGDTRSALPGATGFFGWAAR